MAAPNCEVSKLYRAKIPPLAEITRRFSLAK